MLESTCRAFFDLQGVQLRPAPDAVMTTHCARVVESAPAQNRSEAVEGQIDVPAANRDANPRVGFISYSRRPAPGDALLSGPTSRSATADERDRSGVRQLRFADRVRRPQEREARTETDLASVADEGEEGVEDPQLPSQVEQAEEQWRKAADEKRMGEAEAKSRRAEEMQRRSDGDTDPTVSFPGTGDIREAWERGARAAARAHVGEAGEELASNVRQHIEEDRGYVKVRLPSLKRKAVEEARRGDVDVPENSGEAKKKEESNAGAKAHKMVEVEAHQNAEDAAHRFVDAEAALTAEDGAPKEAESAAQQKVGAEAVKVEAVAQKESEAMASQKDEAAAQQNDEADTHKESAAAAQQKDEGAAPRMVEAEAQKESEAAAQQKEEGAAPKMVEAEVQKASEAAALQKEGAAPKMVEAEAQKASEAAALQKEEGAAPNMVEAEAQKESKAAALQKEEGAAPNMVEAEAQKESEAVAREKDKAAALHMEEADAHKEGEARNKAEAAARQKAEAEEQKQAAEEALQLARAEARKKAVVEAQKKAEGEAQKMVEAEEQKQAEADARRKPDGEDGSDGNKMVQTEGRETAGAEGHIIAEEEGQHNEEAASQVFAYRETQSMAETGRQNTMEEVRVVPEAGVGHYEGDALETEEEQNEEDTVHPAVRIFLGGSPTRGPGTGVEGPWRVANDGAPRDTVDLNRQRRPTLHQRAVERNLGQGGVAEAFWQVEWVEAETAIRRMLHWTSTVLVEQGDRFVEAESWDISPAEVTRRLTLLARMVTQTFCNLAARNSSISRDVADLTVHYCRDALANLEEVRHGNKERRRQAETAARFREEVDTRLSNLQESIVRVSDQVRQSGGGMAEGTLKRVEERLREVLREDSERRNRDRLQDEERRQKAMRKEADATERRKKEQQQEEARRQKEMREGMKEMKEAMMKEMKAEMKEMKDGMVNQIVGRLSAVLREESERQKKERQVDAERRQQQDAKRKQVADDEERHKRKQLDEQWRKEEEVKRKDVEATERRRKNKHQEEERRQKEVEAGMKEVMEAVKEMKTGIKGWKEGMLKKRARLASYAEQQRQLEAKAKAMAEETERLAREMEEEDLTMQGEGTWTGAEEEIAEGLGSLLLIESGEANVAEGVASVPVRNIEVSRRRPRQEDREPEGHAAKRRRAAGIQELIPIIQGEKKGMKIDKCDNRKNAAVDDKGKTLGACLPFRGSGFSQRGEGALQKWTSEQTVGGRKRNLGSHKTVWERAYTVAVCWKFYFPDIDMQAYGMNPNRINKWREDLDFTTWLPTGVWSVINELHLDKPDGFSLVQTSTALRQQQGDGFQVAACTGVGITAWQKMVGGVEGENGYSTEEHAIGLAATLSVMWAASTNVDQTQWETGATTAARGTSTTIASSAARSSTAATASSAASSSSAADVPSAVHNALATLAASVACVAVEAMRSVKDQEHDKEAWILPLSDALLKALPAESRAAEDAKRMTRVVAKVVTSWCLCSMASRGLRQHQGVWLGVLQKKLGGRDTTTGADKEKKTKKSSAKGNATKDASTEENTGTGGQE
ncbi:unnamed protein product [Closterium sp. NIES-64]|nr:unnamed protein product [Closterium sp. NIES-64]